MKQIASCNNLTLVEFVTQKFNYLQIALLKRAVEKFKSQLGADSASILSENSPKNSLTYHRITPISPSYQASEGQKGKDFSIIRQNTQTKIIFHTLYEIFNLQSKSVTWLRLWSIILGCTKLDVPCGTDNQRTKRFFFANPQSRPRQK